MKYKLLLIEDDCVDQESIRRCVAGSSVGYDVEIVDTIAAAKELLSQRSHHVVLTDLNLPDASGDEAVHCIRQASADVPIIVLSGLESEAIALSAIQNGAQDFLNKGSLTTESIERAIRYAVERQKSYIETRNLNRDLQKHADLLLSQQQQLEGKNKKLHRLYKTAHKFVDNVSHEFRTPLAVIKDYVSLVGEGMVGEINEQQQQMLDVVGVRADDLNNMVDDMLDVSKLESGMLGAWRRDCRLEDVLAHVMPALQRKADVKKIDLQMTVPEDLPSLYCDSEKVGRVIINLVSNAMKFCGDPGNVRVVCGENVEAGEVFVEIHDNGDGIDAADLEAIFARFRQVNSDIRSSTKGFGLGLNIARELVDINFGEMNVESTLGTGSCFSFTIPTADPVKITRRYLNRLPDMDSDLDSCSLIQCKLRGVVSEQATVEIEAFLQTALRRFDMVFQSDDGEWLMVVPVRESGLKTFIERVLTERDRANRNRVRGDLPEFDLTAICTSSLLSEKHVLLDQFTARMTRRKEQPKSPFASPKGIRCEADRVSEVQTSQGNLTVNVLADA